MSPNHLKDKKKVTFSIGVNFEKSESRNKNQKRREGELEEHYLSPYTLRINNTAMDNEYTSYQRANVLQRTKYLVILYMIFTIFMGIIAVSYWDDDSKKSGAMFNFVIQAIPLFCLFVMYKFAAKYEVCVDFLGPVFSLSFALTIVFLNYTDLLPQDTEIRNH